MIETISKSYMKNCLLEQIFKAIEEIKQGAAESKTVKITMEINIKIEVFSYEDGDSLVLNISSVDCKTEKEILSISCGYDSQRDINRAVEYIVNSYI